MRFEKEVREQYLRANHKAIRAQKNSAQLGIPEHPIVLECILSEKMVAYRLDLGVMDIPVNQIVGITGLDRKELLYASDFMPLSEPDTEFSRKWRSIYLEFLSEKGLDGSIRCYEYLGRFYVQDGAKRVSVLKHHGALTVSAHIIRIMPICTTEQQIQCYYEFLHHFRLTRLYQISFTRPEHFVKLQAALGHEANYRWNEADRYGFLFHWCTIENAFQRAYEGYLTITAADALVVLLESYSYDQIIKMPVWVLTRVFQANWKRMYELSFPDFSLVGKREKASENLQTA